MRYSELLNGAASGEGPGCDHLYKDFNTPAMRLRMDRDAEHGRGIAEPDYIVTCILAHV